MKKLLVFLAAVTMVIAIGRPVQLYAEGSTNPFKDIFPIDIPVPDWYQDYSTIKIEIIKEINR